MEEKPSLLKQHWLRHRAVRKARGRESELVVLLNSQWPCLHLPSGRQGGQGSSPVPAPSPTPLTGDGTKFAEKVNSRSCQKCSALAMRAQGPTQLASFLLVAGNQQKQRKNVGGKR